MGDDSMTPTPPRAQPPEIESAEEFFDEFHSTPSGDEQLAMIEARDAQIERRARAGALEEAAQIAHEHTSDGDDVSDPSIMCGWWQCAEAIEEEIRELAAEKPADRTMESSSEGEVRE